MDIKKIVLQSDQSNSTGNKIIEILGGYLGGKNDMGYGGDAITNMYYYINQIDNQITNNHQIPEGYQLVDINIFPDELIPIGTRINIIDTNTSKYKFVTNWELWDEGKTPLINQWRSSYCDDDCDLIIYGIDIFQNELFYNIEQRNYTGSNLLQIQATNIEIKQINNNMDKKNLPIGTRVIITGRSNNHGFSIGDIAIIDHKPEDNGHYILYRNCLNEDGTRNGGPNLRDTDFELETGSGKIIGYRSTEECYLLPVGTLFIPNFDKNLIGNNKVEGYSYYPCPHANKGTSSSQTVPKKLVEKYFTPVYEDEVVILPSVKGYDGEYDKDAKTIKYGCQTFTYDEVKKLVEKTIVPLEIKGTVKMGSGYNIPTDKIVEVYNLLKLGPKVNIEISIEPAPF